MILPYRPKCTENVSLNPKDWPLMHLVRDAYYIVMHRACPDTVICCEGAKLELGRSRWLDLDRGIVTATPKVHAAILKAIGSISQS